MKNVDSSLTSSKILQPLSGETTVLEYAVRTVLRAGICQKLLLVIRREDEALIRAKPGIAAECSIVYGGATRQESVFNALQAINGKTDFVMVHDGARPLCRAAIMQRVVAKAQVSGAALAGLAVSDTLKETVSGETILKTVSRQRYWTVQTPQVFRFDWLWEAHLAAQKDGYIGTDESELVERAGHRVSLVQGDKWNLKITTPEDLQMARLIAASISS